MPYWEVFSTDVYNSLPGNHPYRYAVDAPEYAQGYVGYSISNAISNGLYSNNSPTVTNGFIISKLLRQFKKWEGVSTIDENGYANGDILCTYPLFGYGIVDYFNQHKGNPFPNQFDYFTQEDELECVGSSGSGGDSGIKFPNVDERISKFSDCVFDLFGATDPTMSQVSKCFDSLFGLGNFGKGIYATGFELQSLDKGMDFNYIFKKADSKGNTYVVYNKGNTNKIKPGLYRTLFYFSENTVFPTVIEFNKKEGTNTNLMKDGAMLSIAPNPVIDNKLHFNMSVNQNIQGAKTFVHNMNGELLYSSNVNFSSANMYEGDVDLENANMPYNQVILTIVFPDGSTLQKKALIQK